MQRVLRVLGSDSKPRAGKDHAFPTEEDRMVTEVLHQTGAQVRIPQAGGSLGDP